jgi:uncharacterized protein
MSDNILNVPFLDNVRQGKNNWWRYLITICLMLGFLFFLGPIFAALVISVPIILMGLLTQSFDVNSYYQMTNSSLFKLILSGISFFIDFIVFYICLRFIHHKKLLPLINTGVKVNWGKIVKGAGIWLVILLLFDIISYIIHPQGLSISFNPQKFILLIIVALLAVPIQASFEEVFFRGYLLQGTSLLFKKPVWALILTSIFFASMHFTYGSLFVLNMFIIGITLGIIALVDNGIEIAVGVHIINNIYLNVIHSSPDAGLGTFPSLMVNHSSPILSSIIISIAAIILLAILFRGRSQEITGIFK